ncbi:uncharacterized protein LOC121734900 [Aricia agestis]|uniref:uncharacterized protein LOC121734900 n=1 Tax=Aricia agestis TaxID=91739 RepID=UPI001C20B0F2|nr:uncharacterized protein LOC121734900 [Aricia agestis]
MFCEIPKFARCCFCLPLRQGILTFGYLNILIDSLMVAIYSYSINRVYGTSLLYHGAVSYMFEDEFSIAMYVIEILFTIVLLYGAHMKHLIYLKTFYYYALCTCVATVLLEILSLISNGARDLDLFPLFMVGLCIHVYLIFLVGSLIKKMETSGMRFENELHQFINGETPVRPEGTEVYPTTVVPNNDV